MIFYTYVLISERDKKFYIGFTKNIHQRIRKHNDGLVTSTEHRRPLKLIYFEACLNEKDAIKREKYFKSGYGRRFLNNRIESFLKEIK